MDLAGGNLSNGTKFVVSECDGSPTQSFKLNLTEDLVSLAAGKCGDVYFGQPTDGQPVILWPCTGTANQTWWLR